MAYTRTQAGVGLGTIIYADTSGSGVGSPPAWTPIGEVTSIKRAGATSKTDEATNFSSQAEEFVGTIRGEGTYDCVANRLPLDAGFIFLQSTWQTVPPPTQYYRIQYPKFPGQSVAGDQMFFYAILEKFMDGEVSPSKKIPLEFTFKITGPVVETPGS